MQKPNTPPTEVDEWNLALDLAKIEQQWPSFLEVLERDDSFDRSAPEISKWSAGMHAGHISLGSAFMAQMVQECLEDGNQEPAGQWADFTEKVFQRGGFKRGGGEAPQPMRPENHSREDLLQALSESRAQWLQLASQADRIEASGATRKHFAFGELNASDWTRLCAMHAAHHLRIIEDIRAAAADR